MNRDPVPERLPSDLPDAMDAEVLLVNAPDLAPRGDRQNAADRLDPVPGAMRVDRCASTKAIMA
jgi:hypothetical protein